MSDVTSVLLQQIGQLEKERKILQAQYAQLPANHTYCKDEKMDCKDEKKDCKGEKKDCKDEKKDCKDEKKDCKDDKKDCKDENKDSTDERPSFLCDEVITSYLWLQAGKSIQRFKNLLLEGDAARALKLQDLVDTLVRVTLPHDREVRLAEVQKDEKIRLAEIAREEKVRLQELTNEEKERQAKIAGDEKVRLAELAKEEKIRLGELAESEKVRLRELSNELHEQDKNEKIRLEELRLEGIRFVEGVRKDVDLRIAELDTPARRIYATKDAAAEGHQSNERKLEMILKHIEIITESTRCMKAKSSDNTHCSVNDTGAGGTPPEYVFGDVERMVQLTERVASLFEHGAGEAATAESSDDIPRAEVSEAAEQAHEAPVEQEPEAPVEQEPEAPIEQEPEAPVEQEPEAPVEQEPEAPVEQEPEAPAE